jgi:hypothetical protein
MKGIYLTQEGKQEIEAKIAERRKYSPIETEDDWYENGELNVYKEILESATILPVEENWLKVFNIEQGKTTPETYPNGVIIKSKQ